MPCPWPLPISCLECPASLLCASQKTFADIVQCPQVARTSVFILQMRKPRPRESECVLGALSEAGITLGLSCSEAGVLSICPSGAGHAGSSHWQTQSLCPALLVSLWPQSSARPLTWGRAFPSSQKNTYSLAG